MLDSIERRRVRLPKAGVEIAVLDWGGDGPLALLHHANGFCAGLWGPVAEALRSDFRVIALDARGHGDSSKPDDLDAYSWAGMAEDLIELADALLSNTGRERIGLGLGHSFGGTLTLAAASRRPELYERLLLVDPVILPSPGSAADELFRRAGGGTALAERARKRRSSWPSREAARAFFAERELFEDWQPCALDLYVQEALRDRPDGEVELKCSGAVESAIFRAGRGLDIHARAARIEVPARFLWARRGSFPRAFYEDLTAGMGDAAIQDVDAGHLIPMERPDIVAEAARQFTGAALDPAATG